jgi:hypothetical protein
MEAITKMLSLVCVVMMVLVVLDVATQQKVPQ